MRTRLTDRAPHSMQRRAVLRALAGSTALAMTGCCNLRSFPHPAIGGQQIVVEGAPLRPVRIVKHPLAPPLCVDAHAHFFNASDVPVGGYLEGPVAHSMDPQLGDAIRALAGFADELARLAPTAAAEHAALGQEFAALAAHDASVRRLALREQAEKFRAEQSRKAAALLRGSKFETEFNRLQQRNRTLAPAAAADTAPFGDDSISGAIVRGRQTLARAQRRAFATREAANLDGLLRFVGYMLSYRWMNLQEYSEAFSSDDNAFGVDIALGALVDFDRWLDCPLHSAHDDQIELHALLSRLSGGYLRPLVAYNPWTDVADHGRSLERVKQAMRRPEFVGVKIYPANGFRPLGNESDPPPAMPGRPAPKEIEAALLEFWTWCARQEVPVLAHTSESMGRDDGHDTLGGPIGWHALDQHFRNAAKRPVVALGHFGGEETTNPWTDELAGLIAGGRGADFFADLGYWDKLQCLEGAACSRPRLEQALRRPGVADRVLYGSDWLMLSKEPEWPRYPERLAQSTAGLIDADKLFGTNARRCYARLT